MRTLVLNAGYEPLSVVSFKRAVVLVLNGKASVLAESDEPLRSPGSLRREGLSLATPSVILLVRYVRAPRRRAVAVSRRGVLRRDAHRCAYCGKAAKTVDHIVPQSRGGKWTWLNTVAACSACNGRKANRTPEEAGMRLLIEPYVPTRAEAVSWAR